MYSMSQHPLPPAGWHPDPSNPGQLRYWDGTAWTDHTHPTTVHSPGSHHESALSPGTTPTGSGDSTSKLWRVARICGWSAGLLAIVLLALNHFNQPSLSENLFLNRIDYRLPLVIILGAVVAVALEYVIYFATFKKLTRLSRKIWGAALPVVTGAIVFLTAFALISLSSYLRFETGLTSPDTLASYEDDARSLVDTYAVTDSEWRALSGDASVTDVYGDSSDAAVFVKTIDFTCEEGLSGEKSGFDFKHMKDADNQEPGDESIVETANATFPSPGDDFSWTYDNDGFYGTTCLAEFAYFIDNDNRGVMDISGIDTPSLIVYSYPDSKYIEPEIEALDEDTELYNSDEDGFIDGEKFIPAELFDRGLNATTVFPNENTGVNDIVFSWATFDIAFPVKDVDSTSMIAVAPLGFTMGDGTERPGSGINEPQNGVPPEAVDQTSPDYEFGAESVSVQDPNEMGTIDDF